MLPITANSTPVAACVVDLDNLLHRGRDKRLGCLRPRANVDVQALASALRERDVTRSIVYRNWSFSLLEERLWDAHGFETRSVGVNCDPHVIEALVALVDAGCRHLILIAGDDDYSARVTRLRARGVRIEIWSRRTKTAATLAASADAVRYLDELIHIPQEIAPVHHPAVP